MKSTLICLHVLPHEFELLERFIIQLRKSYTYLDNNDSVTLKVSLNLNPQLVDWSNSEVRQEYFLHKFESMFDGIPNINEVVLDDRLMGTTQQKRESIELNYDQFIFVDADIALHEQMLKYQLEGSYRIQGKYLISPQIVKWWDPSWDILVHKDYMEKEYQYCFKHDSELTYTQPVDNIELLPLPLVKFGCGMHTLYSKEFWDFIKIPQSFGGYGPEDTFAMTASMLAKKKGYDITQYLLKGLYINENHTQRIPSFQDKLVMFDRKQEFRDNAESNFQQELEKFYHKI